MGRNIKAVIIGASGTITAVANNKSYTVPRDHVNYNAVRVALNNDDAVGLEAAVNVQKALKDFGAPLGGVEVREQGGNFVVYWQNAPMHNAMSQRLLTLLREGFDIKPMQKFIANLMSNPSKRAVEELYNFLEHQGLPITEDGCFLGYKRVTDEYLDNFSKKIDNRIGQVIEMPRNTVDDEWRNACSSGFHVGSIEYVRSFHANTGHVMIVKVNPADVVSVPNYDATKLRTCKYEVVGEYDRDLEKPMADTLYTPQGTPSTAPEPPAYNPPQDEDEFEDEDDEKFDDEDDEDDGDDEGEDEDESESEFLNRVSAKAENLNPAILAFNLDVSKASLGNNPTVRSVLEIALRDQYEDEIENTVDELLR